MPAAPTLANLPRPESSEDRDRMAISARRWRLLNGMWHDDAQRRQHEFFNKSIVQTLPEPELGCNPFLSYVIGTCTLYDLAYMVRIAGSPSPEDRAMVLTPRLRPLQQTNLINAQGMRESLMRADWIPGSRHVTYRPVESHLVCATPNPLRPSELVAVQEWQVRTRTKNVEMPYDLWTRETWDVSTPTAPVYRIDERSGTRGWRDVTAEFAGGPGYPYLEQRDGETVGIMPYALYHARVSARMWNASVGEELVKGTLSTSTLWTFWLGGVRDTSHPQRVILNGTIKNLATRGGVNGVQVGEVSPLTILEIGNTGVEGTSASIAQWQPGMDPLPTAEAIAMFVAQLAVFAGISAADITVGTAGLSRVSGAAITVSRQGQQRAREAVRVPMQEGDQILLSIAARLANAYGGARLPTEPEDYAITYPEPDKSLEEVTAELEHLEALVEKGHLSKVDAHMRVHPEMDRAEALADLIRIAAEDRALADATKPATLESPNARRDTEASHDSGADDSTDDNGRAAR